MNSSERVLTAMQNRTPDCVPVSLGITEPGPFLGLNNMELYWEKAMPVWQARFQAECVVFKADGYFHVSETPSPEDPPCEMTDVRASRDEVTFARVIHTDHGDLISQHKTALDCTPCVISYPVTDPEADYEKILDLLRHPDTKGLEEIQEGLRVGGDNAHVGYWINSPIDWWRSLRGAEVMIMDLYDYPETIGKLFQAYQEYMVTMVDYVLQNTPVESVGIGGSTTSMSVISPELHRRHSLDFGKAICDVAHRNGRPVQYHMCGRSREALSITAEMGVDGFDALESPPTGNVDLAEVKQTFGDRISLRGNVNSITVMLNGGPKEVEKEVQRCMAAAKENGGFILAVGDQMPSNTPVENIHALVEYGRRYGQYA